MDAAIYAKILSDKSIVDLKKLGYKYPGVDIKELIELLKSSVYKTLPIWDFNGNEAVYMENAAIIRMNTLKLLLTSQTQSALMSYGLKAMEDEITSTLMIENIDFNRDSVRKILQGYAPSDERENRVYGMKKGLEFIANPSNIISEENIFLLYDMAVGQYLHGEEKLNAGEYYRHDNVFIIGQDIEHTGLLHTKLCEYMAGFVAFIRQDSPMNDLIKAAIIHFYFAYLHPYFDGNGRMARLMHMWFLRQQGYSSALFVPFSSHIERSRKQYYDAYTLSEANARISGVTDITPFLVYFTEYVYNRLDTSMPRPDTLQVFNGALESGSITSKERDLWNFVLSFYGDREFSTKQLERDFGNAAYATIRGFVLKFTGLELLKAQKYGNRTKYAVCF
ncbi:MAG: Fic family protein [Oscillospiraceae bacterium]|jgi:Fic family protein|nr:Fic family protein [Oscillospiraceae bacterium]